MTTHMLGQRWHYGVHDIILLSDGYSLQEVATGRNPLWWDENTWIGGFDTLDDAMIAAAILDSVEDGSWAFSWGAVGGSVISQQDAMKEALFNLKGI